MESTKDTNLHNNKGQTHSVSPFIQNGTDSVLFDLFKKRAEKIVMAIYMVTNYIETNDPIRDRLRYQSVELLSDISLPVSQMSFTKKESFHHSITLKISEIVSLFEIASSVGLVSEMNTSILKKELLGLKNKINEEIHAHKVSIEEYIFSDSILPDVEKEQKDISDIESKRQTISANSNAFSTASKSKFFDNELDYKNDKNNSASILQKKDNFSFSKNQLEARSEKIISIIKDISEATIKDISTKISDCGEKTIQRELAALVEKGVLKRTGEKRWSRYSVRD